MATNTNNGLLIVPLNALKQNSQAIGQHIRICNRSRLQRPKDYQATCR